MMDINGIPRDPYRQAVVDAVVSGRVAVLWTLKARMFVLDCFCPGATEGVMDADELWPYLWELEFELHGDDPCDLDLHWKDEDFK